MVYSKVSEAIMTKLLMSWAENTDKLPTEQSGLGNIATNDNPGSAIAWTRGRFFLDILGIRLSLAHRLTLRTTRYECARFAAQMHFQLSKG